MPIKKSAFLLITVATTLIMAQQPTSEPKPPERDDCKQLSNYGTSFHFTVLDSDVAISQQMEPARLTLVPSRLTGSTHLSIRAGAFAQDGEFSNNPDPEILASKRQRTEQSINNGRFEFAVCNRYQQGSSINATGKACIFPEKSVRIQTNQPVSAAVSQGDESYTLIPDAAAGQEYLAAGWFPPSNPGNAITQNVLAIVSLMDNTTVTIDMPPDVTSWTCQITFGAKTYQAGDRIELDLEKDNSLVIQAKCDLTGILIRATRPFAVFSSINRRQVGGSIGRSIMQLPPTTAWGKRHVAFKTPDLQNGNEQIIDVWKIVALNDTQVNLFHSDIGQTETIYIKGRTCFSMALRDEKWVEISSSQPVLVLQIVMDRDGSTPQDAAVHSPLEQYKTRMMLPRYLLWPHNLTMVVVRKQAQGPLTMNDAPLQVGEWAPQPNMGTAVAALPLTSGLMSSFLKLTSPSAAFSAYVVERFDTNNVRLFSGGTCYDQLVISVLAGTKVVPVTCWCEIVEKSTYIWCFDKK